MDFTEAKKRPDKSALKKLNANKIAKKFHDFAEYAVSAATKQHFKRPLHIFQEPQAHNYLFLKLAVFLSSSPARGAIYRRELPYALRKDFHSDTE